LEGTGPPSGPVRTAGMGGERHRLRRNVVRRGVPTQGNTEGPVPGTPGKWFRRDYAGAEDS